MPSFPITLDWLPDGELLTPTPAGDLVRVATLSDLSAMPWNEVVTYGELIYVNCIGYPYPGPAQVSGIIALVKPDGGATVVAVKLTFPNGMAVIDNGNTLVVAESNAGCLTGFDILPDGSLVNRHVWAAVPGSAPDGICAGDGGIWYADVPNHCCVLVARGGNVLRKVQLKQGCFSCAVGAENLDMLLVMTADWPEAMEPGAPATGRALAVGV